VKRRRILLTGLPGCGKTTVVRKVAEHLRGLASGFYTEEIRDDRGQRIGFRVTSLDGKRGELARKGTGNGPRVGPYGVDVKDFERIALPSLEVEERGVLLIDEIGKMECYSKEFLRRVEKAFESDISILATIPLRGGDDFIDKIRREKDVETILVTRENRDELPEQLVAKLTSRPAT
jgi:nucleoside-triphosphatase THEP1